MAISTPTHWGTVDGGVAGPFTIPAGERILVVSMARRVSINVATTTCGDTQSLTWTEILNQRFHAGGEAQRLRVSIFEAVSNGSPTTITVSGTNSARLTSVFSYSGATAVGANVLSATSLTGDPTVTLAAAASGSAIFAGLISVGPAPSMSPVNASGYTQVVGQADAGSVVYYQVAYDLTSPSNTLAWTSDGAESMGWALEIPAAASGVLGAGAVTLGSLSRVAAGGLELRGAGAVAFGPMTRSATGELELRGGAAVALGPLSGAASGTSSAAGVATAAMADLTSAAVGSLALAGAAGVSPGAISGDATGAVSISGTAFATMAPLAGSAAGALALAGAAVTSFASLSGAATGVLAPLAGTGSGAAILSALAGSSDARLVVTGQGGVALAAISASAEGLLSPVPISGVGDVALADLAALASGTLAIAGHGEAALDALTGLGGTSVARVRTRAWPAESMPRRAERGMMQCRPIEHMQTRPPRTAAGRRRQEDW